MIDAEIQRFWVGQSEMIKLAEEALDRTPKIARKKIRNLLLTATALATEFAPYEGTDDPVVLSANVLSDVASMDPREPDEIRFEDDSELEIESTLQRRQERLGAVLTYLSNLVDSRIT